jgi:hypothetical protein
MGQHISQQQRFQLNMGGYDNSISHIYLDLLTWTTSGTAHFSLSHDGARINSSINGTSTATQAVTSFQQ